MSDFESRLKKLDENRGGRREGAGRKRKTASELKESGAPDSKVEARAQLEALAAFVETVAAERSSFFERLVPDSTVVGTEFSWPPDHPLTVMRAYAEGVVSESIVAGSLVKCAARRFLSDLDRGFEREVFIDPVAVENIATWFSKFGEFPLQPWELFIVGQLMGWKRLNGTRRFREGWFEIGKKNGKTALMGGLALFLIIADQEEDAEVYSLANKRDQAKLCFKAAKRMRDSNSALRETVKAFQSALVYGDSTYQFISSESKTVDGPNVHAVFLDEVHEFSDDELYTKITQGRVARRQPLVVSSTTAGNRPESFAGQRHEFFSNLLRGVFEDDSKFAFVASLDEVDDWKDEKCWPKAQPNLGAVSYTHLTLPTICSV